VRHVAVALGLALAWLATSEATAGAFCRSRTIPPDPANDPSRTGRCTTEGVPLLWRNRCVGYNIDARGSRQVSPNRLAEVVARSFTRWTSASCAGVETKDGARTSIDVRDLGPVTCNKVGTALSGPNTNVIVFRDDEWLEKDGGRRDSEKLAVTTVRFDPETGEIFGADMEVNTFDHVMVTEAPAPKEWDLASVMTHEAGHFLGMGHSGERQAVMFTPFDQGRVSARELFADDVTGICEVYRPDGSRAVLEGSITEGGACDPVPRGGLQRDCEATPEPAGCGVSPSIPAVNRRLGEVFAVALFATAALRMRRRTAR
jgi:hypothetical protein